MNLDDLKRPFPVNRIRWRVGATNKEKTSGIALAYIDARDVMQRLDEVCGIGGWQCRYPFLGCCEIGIYIDPEVFATASGDTFQPVRDGWVWKSNGAGATDVEGEKGQYSDAFKRAGVMWGIGRYLYSLNNEWVPIQLRGRSYVLAKHPELPEWATPTGYDKLMEKRNEKAG